MDKLLNIKQCRNRFKPEGLWLSDDNDYGWLQWNSDNHSQFEPNTGHFKFKHTVELNEDVNILHLDSTESLDEFTYMFPNEDSTCKGTPTKLNVYAIDWVNVAKVYDGIFITPYQWSRRLNLMWYYGWDCASGCIWKRNAIQDIKVVENDT